MCIRDRYIYLKVVKSAPLSKQGKSAHPSKFVLKGLRGYFVLYLTHIGKKNSNIHKTGAYRGVDRGSCMFDKVSSLHKW